MRPGIGRRLRRRPAVMDGSDVGAFHGIDNLTTGSLMIGCSVAVSVRVIVTAAGGREVMPSAERTIRHEGKRRHHRQGGRKASA